QVELAGACAAGARLVGAGDFDRAVEHLLKAGPRVGGYERVQAAPQHRVAGDRRLVVRGDAQLRVGHDVDRDERAAVDQRPDGLDRYVGEQAAVDVQLAVVADRRQDAGRGVAGQHRLREVAL